VAVIKLQEEGQTLTAVVLTAERVKGQYGEQVKFGFEQGDLYVPLDSALRQLERIPIAIEECAGETLTFSRDPNNSRPGAKPYWGIKVASVVEKSAPAQSKRIPPPSKKPLPFDEESFPKDGPYAEDAQNYPIRQANMPDLSDAPLPPEPEWVTAPAPARSVAPKAEAKLAYISAYLDLLGYVKAHSGLKDEVAIQAATATLHIGLKQEGLR
jgi:hypothetical protein